MQAEVKPCTEKCLVKGEEGEIHNFQKVFHPKHYSWSLILLAKARRVMGKRCLWYQSAHLAAVLDSVLPMCSQAICGMLTNPTSGMELDGTSPPTSGLLCSTCRISSFLPQSLGAGYQQRQARFSMFIQYLRRVFIRTKTSR